MKKLLILLIVLSTFLWSECLVKLNSTKYGLFGFGEMNYGVHDICLYDNYAYITFNSDYLSGLAEVNISIPQALVSFIENDEYIESNLSEYFNDLSEITTIYPDFYDEIKLVTALNERLILGVTPNEIKAAVLNNDGTLNMYDEYIYYYYITDAVNDVNGTYIGFSDNEHKFKVSKVTFYEENRSFEIQDIYAKYSTDEDVGYVSLTTDSDDIILDTFYNVYKIKKDGSEVENITDKFSKMGAPSILSDLFGVYNDRYLIAAGGYNLYIIDLETGDYYSKEYNTTPLAKLDGNMLYVVNSGYNGVIEILDVSNPLSPKSVASISNDNFLVGNFALKDGKLYLAAEWAGLMVYDVSTCGEQETESEEDITQYCVTKDDIDALNAGEWVLLGSGCDINDMSIFDGVKVVWVYENGEWKAYSSDPEIMRVISENYKVLDSIKAKEGFWIYK